VWEAFRHLLITALSVAAKNDDSKLEEVFNVVDLDEKGNLINKRVHKSVMLRFMKMYFDENIDFVWGHWQHFDDYFLVLQYFSQLGHWEAQFLIEQKGIFKLLDFIGNN